MGSELIMGIRLYIIIGETAVQGKVQKRDLEDQGKVINQALQKTDRGKKSGTVGDFEKPITSSY